MKTYKEWYDELPEPYNEMAYHHFLKQQIHFEDREPTLKSALLYGFIWDRTEEGYDFWDAIYDEVAFNDKRYINQKSQAQKLAELINGKYDSFSDGSACWVELSNAKNVICFSFDATGNTLERIWVNERVFTETDQKTIAKIEL